MNELIAVVGMHRSGTSLAAHLVHELGVQALGASSSLVSADEFNARGYWESQDLIPVSTYLCNFLGCDWRHPVIPPRGWERGQELAPLRRWLGRLVRAMPAERRSLKDPRMTITLPFWQTLVPASSTVFCLRSPLHVARSLERRERMDIPRALGLWTVHTALGIQNSGGRPRLFAVYDDLLANPVQESQRVAAFLGVDRERAAAAADAVVSPELSHSGIDLDEDAAAAPLGREGESAAALWRSILTARADAWSDASLSALDGVVRDVLAHPPLEPPSAAYRRRHRLRFLVKSLHLIAAAAAAPRSSVVLPGGRAFGPTRRIDQPEKF